MGYPVGPLAPSVLHGDGVNKVPGLIFRVLLFTSSYIPAVLFLLITAFSQSPGVLLQRCQSLAEGCRAIGGEELEMRTMLWRLRS